MTVTVTSITPQLGAQGGHLFGVKIIGTGFVTGAVVTFSGANVTAEGGSTVVDSATQIRLNVLITGGAATTARTVTVTNVDTSAGNLPGGFTIKALSFQVFQPYNRLPGIARNCLLYDPRGDAAPFLYSFGQFPNGSVWVLNRRTGAITNITGQFNPQGSFGPGDMDEFGTLWWVGNESNNLTFARQAQTAFAADTLTRVGSVVTGGTTVLYPLAGQVRVDRHSSHHLVWQLAQGDLHSDHGDLHAWNRDTRVQVYALTAASWDGVPVGGLRNRVWDFDSDAAGNLWLVTLDDTSTYTLLWKVTPDGTQTLVTNLSAQFPGGGQPSVRWVQADNSLFIGADTHLAKCRVSDGAVTATATAPLTIQIDENYQSFHHTIDGTSMFLVVVGATGPVFYEVSLLTLATIRSIDFAGVAGCVGIFFNGFSQANDAVRAFHPTTALYDSKLGGCWCEDKFQGGVGAFAFGDLIPPPLVPVELTFQKTLCLPRVITLKTFHYDVISLAEGENPVPILNSTIDDLVLGSADQMIRQVQAIPPGLTLTKAWLTIKENLQQTDDEAPFQKVITPTLGANGQITDDGSIDGVGRLVFALYASEMSRTIFSTRKFYYYDIKVLTSDGNPYARELGRVRFVQGVTEAVA